MESHPNIQACGTGIVSFGDGEPITWLFPESDAQIRILMFTNPPIGHAAALLRRSAAEGIRYNPDFLHAEDYDFWRRFLLLNRAGNIRDVLYRYRQHSSQVSAVHKQIQARNSRRCRRDYLENFLSRPVNDDEFLLHDHLFNFRLPHPSDEDFLQKGADLLGEIWSANGTSGIVLRKQLDHHLRRIWYFACSGADYAVSFKSFFSVPFLGHQGLVQFAKLQVKRLPLLFL